MTNLERVHEFHEAFEVPTGVPFSTAIREARERLIEEEYDEVMVAFAEAEETGDPAPLAKELADLLYVVYGTGDVLGIDMDAVFAEVHRSNMTKLGPDGKPVFDERGKVLKGPGYEPARIAEVLAGQRAA